MSEQLPALVAAPLEEGKQDGRLAGELAAHSREGEEVAAHGNDVVNRGLPKRGIDDL